MNGLAQAAALISAVAYIAAAPLELSSSITLSAARPIASSPVQRMTSPTIAPMPASRLRKPVQNAHMRMSATLSASTWRRVRRCNRAVLHAPRESRHGHRGSAQILATRGESVLSTLGSSLPPLVALVAAAL
jgi:hypothetical protein